jgi:hypothetical protein
MQALVREAVFYRLPGLLQLISSASMAPSPGTREVWDSVYVETGFSSMQGEQLQQLERSKVRAVLYCWCCCRFGTAQHYPLRGCIATRPVVRGAPALSDQ